MSLHTDFQEVLHLKASILNTGPAASSMCSKAPVCSRMAICDHNHYILIRINARARPQLCSIEQMIKCITVPKLKKIVTTVYCAFLMK